MRRIMSLVTLALMVALSGAALAGPENARGDGSGGCRTIEGVRDCGSLVR